MNTALQKKQLPYSPDLAIHYFAPLSASPWAMLLHSGAAEHPHNRFDIFVSEPIATLVTRGETTEIRLADETSFSQEDPFLLLKKYLNACDISPAFDPELPFQGGALGIWGYDLGRRVEKLPTIAANELDFPDMAIGIYDWAVIVDHQQQKATLLSYQNIDKRLAWLQSLQENKESHFSLTNQWKSNMTEQQYHEKIAQIHRYLQSGDCYQINLSQRFQANYQGDEWQAFTQLNESNRAPFSAFIRLPEHCIISVSPERFILLEDKQIQTRPIKGTLPRRQDPVEDQLQAEKLASSRKDRAENLMIVDLLRNDIGRVAKPGSVKVPELFVVEPFPAVHHLVSTITATLPDEYHATDLLRACFPGGSITGAPKIRAMEIIEELEPHRRHGYCGAIGYISFCGTMDSNITIRTLLTEKGKIYCWAGGGIVADSIAEKEYQETFDKLGRILPQLGELDIP
ncbi:anthranilate synthase component I [Xenorhabdus mauleonii]|uniref:Aminodeoxychorismate synthase component 1 n=1 Tax=Xenorhabdus mauleonii TaxID=351675 RepID=A0A1I3N9A4_9GAMM|nr:aminodeoxychorismate synthase component 1 [Xenorhabdus mauleonii]PHM45740.1 anthranilate synthase component I [Xenorhabdus mauleonii]SFJ05848.1 para-aminobenzoate synthetase component 1 [Xenorhabdus mauleonii]